MKILQAMTVMLAFVNVAQAQVNSGSDGSDGAFNPATSVVIDMTDQPLGGKTEQRGGVRGDGGVTAAETDLGLPSAIRPTQASGPFTKNARGPPQTLPKTLVTRPRRRKVVANAPPRKSNSPWTA